MWQEVRTELHPKGLEIVTVGLDVDADEAKPFIEGANPTHPSLIDQAHVTDELFGFVNVPNAVWIDEQGTIVRPAHAAHVQMSAMREVIASLKRARTIPMTRSRPSRSVAVPWSAACIRNRSK